jgi:hypothetical protein
MKGSNLLTVAFILIASIPAKAQGFDVGIKAGVNYNQISVRPRNKDFLSGVKHCEMLMPSLTAVISVVPVHRSGKCAKA